MFVFLYVIIGLGILTFLAIGAAIVQSEWENWHREKRIREREARINKSRSAG